MLALTILLDLDGTLTDPAEGFVASVSFALTSLGHRAPPAEELLRYIGPPLESTFAQLLGNEQASASAVALYRQRYSTTGLFENSVYAGIVEALTVIQASGARMLLATSKPQVFASRILEHFGLQKFFAAIYGSGFDGSLADKRELIAHILRQEDLQADRVVMVGDRSYDAQGAIANGIFPIGVLWGHGSREELVAAGARICVETPAQLAELLTSGRVPK